MAALCATNVAQFQTLSSADHLAGCNFHLTGVITLVDASRDLVVLQDATGAVALNFPVAAQSLQVGRLVALDGTNCSPFYPSFPAFPYRPSGQNMAPAFEAPRNWGLYYLTRMRGWLHPRVSGNYRFWTASDNSSELWLSPDADPAKARRIANIPRFQFVEPPDWSLYPSQRSEIVELKAGGSYYIEALQEQTTGGDYLNVGWQPPGAVATSIIPGRYLTPWTEDRDASATTTNGILREYWTNFYNGDLTGMGGPRPYASALTVKEVAVHLLGSGELPPPVRLVLDREQPNSEKYRWVRVEGAVKFLSVAGATADLELSAGPALLQVHVAHWQPEWTSHWTNLAVRVEGVCETVYDQNTMVPGLIWATAKNSMTVLPAGAANAAAPPSEPPSLATITAGPAMQGFYSCRGVVTFSAHVFDQDYIVVQQNDTPVLVNLVGLAINNQFQVGQDVEIGGALAPGQYVPSITPLVVTKYGFHSLPAPVVSPAGWPDSETREGRWSELTGVVHAVNPDGTLSLVGQGGAVSLWVSGTPLGSLAQLVDAQLRIRGVLMLKAFPHPMLLVPSRDFLEVREAAPADPYHLPLRPVASLFPEDRESSSAHRVRVAGEVTGLDTHSFFLQDASGGIRVQTPGLPGVKVGDLIEVLAFPTPGNFSHSLADALVRPALAASPASPRTLDLSETFSPRQSGTLVTVSAQLLARKTNVLNQVLELQEQQRVFLATLPASQGHLPDLILGSRLRVTGVCDDNTVSAPLTGEKPPGTPFLGSLNLLLRSPQDVVVLNGPPWWTWRKATTLFGMLVAVLGVTLLWVRLLHRRLERQQAAQLAFSRQVLERLEDERRRIAVNLHDSLGQTLLVIKNHAILAIQRPPEENGVRHRLDEISGATSQAIEEVRRITHGLRPYQLDRLGLTQAIRASVAGASSNNAILFASRVEDIDGLFDKDAEIHVYRIVQEAVTNIVKHSGATEAAVVIKKRAPGVVVSIRDNGRGFNPAQPSSTPHDLGYGLSGMAERVRILGGTLTIDARPDGGAILTIEVPVPLLKP